MMGERECRPWLLPFFFFLDWDINMERFLQEDKRALRERVHLEKRAIEEFHLQTVNRCL